MFGFFGMFGRADELRALDRALNAAGLPRRSVPDAVTLAALRQLQQETGRRKPDEAACDAAAELLAYCLLGPEAFRDANGAARVATTERRIEAALEAGDDLDARLLLLALHAGLVQPDVIQRFDLRAEAG